MVLKSNRVSSVLLSRFVARCLVVLCVFGSLSNGQNVDQPTTRQQKLQEKGPPSQANRQAPEHDSQQPEDKDLTAPQRHKIAGQYVDVFISVLDPRNVSDTFGTRVAKRYVAFQITISNSSKDYEFLLQDVRLNVAPAIRTNYKPSSTDLSVVRGVAEKGASFDKRNLILRFIRAAGTIGGGFAGTGVATFGSSFAPSVALFNGPFTDAFASAFPDFTLNQLNRLNDSAYRTNLLVPKQSSKVIVAFVDQGMLMTNDLRKRFFKDPLSIAKEPSTTGTTDISIDFRKVVPILFGIMITEALDQPPFITNAFIDDDQKKLFVKVPSEVGGYVIGKNLDGAEVSLSNDLPGVTIEQKPDSDGSRLGFIVKADRRVPPDTVLRLVVKKKLDEAKFDLAINYSNFADYQNVPRPRGLSGSEVKQGAGEQEIKITGNAFKPDATLIITPDDSKITVKKHELKDGALVITLQVPDDAKAGDYTVLVSNGDGYLSGPLPFKVKAK